MPSSPEPTAPVTSDAVQRGCSPPGEKSLRINPYRNRPATATGEAERLSRNASSSRAQSETSFLTTTTSPGSGDPAVLSNERTPLMSSHHEGSSENGSVSEMMEGSGAGKGRGGWWSRLRARAQLATRQRGPRFWLTALKVLFLFAITFLCCVVLILHAEDNGGFRDTMASTEQATVIYSEAYDPDYPYLHLVLKGPFTDWDDVDNSTRYNNSAAILAVTINTPHPNDSQWRLLVNRTTLSSGDLATFDHRFHCTGSSTCNISLSIHTSGPEHVPLLYSVRSLSSQVQYQVLYAALTLLFMYTLIIFELVHRSLAAMLGALAALAVLSAINERPSTETVMGWVQMETLMLLFGMMIIVAVLSETGLFDFFALKMYRLAGGRVWPLVTWLCVFSALVSAVLDNVTTILLMTPVTIRLCEVLNLEPRVILIAEVLFSNIGGTATGIGDPPNVIIVSELEDQGVDFGVFTVHLVLGVLLSALAGYGFLRFYYRNMQRLTNPDPPQISGYGFLRFHYRNMQRLINTDPSEISELHHEIDMWRRAASRMVVVTREETLLRALFLQKAAELENLLTNRLSRMRREERDDRKRQLHQLEKECEIKDRVLLAKCGFVLAFVLLCFFTYSFLPSVHMNLGWIAVLGAIWLLVLADISDLENILCKVEWATLLFFAALFIFMEALVDLGLMSWLGEQMHQMIVGVPADYRLAMALLIIMWISALASSFIDNIPYTTAMIPVLKQLSEETDVELKLLPMVIALAFGTCLGGNGTLIGASANVVCAGIADQHGYTISFKQFFKVGFPMMLVTTTVATGYLLLCHIVIEWNE